MVERDWVWDRETYINEHIIADLTTDSLHDVKIEVVKTRQDNLTQLSLSNLVVNKILQNSWDGTRDNLSFMLSA